MHDERTISHMTRTGQKFFHPKLRFPFPLFNKNIGYRKQRDRWKERGEGEKQDKDRMKERREKDTEQRETERE